MTPRARSAHPRTIERTLSSSPLTFLGGLLALYLAGPIVYFLWRCRSTGALGFAGEGLGDAMRTSLLSASLSTALVVVFGVPLARTLARSRGWLGRLVGVAVQLPLALPPVMSGIVLIYLVGPYTWAGEHLPLTDSIWGVVVAQTFVAAPFLVIAARSAFAAIDPEVEDLAATLGLRTFTRFWRVELRLAGSGILAGALLTWLRALGEYGATSLIAYHPETLPVYTSVQFSGDGLGGTSAPTLVALGLAVVVLGLVNLPRIRSHRVPTLPAPRAPLLTRRMPVAFDVHREVGDFRLDAAYAAHSHRLAVLGPSGAGKSMVLKALAGLDPAGHVSFAGEDVTRRTAPERQVGYVPQTRLLFGHRTVWQNVIFSPRATPEQASWWLHELDLTHLAGRTVDGLSGGERQRASLVQALSCDARLLLLDEPFSALDTPTRAALVHRLREVQRHDGISTVLVTHDPREALMLADEVVLLDNGQVLQAGAISEVFNRPGSVRAAQLLGRDDVLPAHGTSEGLDLGAGLVLPVRGACAGSYLVHLPRVSLRLGHHGVPVRIRDVVPCGGHAEALLDIDGHDLHVSVDSSFTLDEADALCLDVDLERVQWWRAT